MLDVVSLWETDSSVIGIVGGATSSESRTIQNVASVFDIPQIAYSSTATSLSDDKAYPTFVRNCPSDDLSARATAGMVATFGWRRAMTVSHTDDFGVSSALAFAQAATEKQVRVAAQISFSPNAPGFDPNTVVDQMVAVPNTHVVYLSAYGFEVEPIIQILKERDLLQTRFVIFASDWLSNGFTGLGPHMVGSFALLPSLGSAGEAFFERWATFNSTLPQAPTILTYLPHVYDAVYHYAVAVSSAIKDLESPRDSNFVQRIISSSFNGVTGTVNLTANGDRSMLLDILNVRADGSVLSVGVWDEDAGTMTITESIVFSGNADSPPYLPRPNAVQTDDSLSPLAVALIVLTVLIITGLTCLLAVCFCISRKRKALVDTLGMENRQLERETVALNSYIDTLVSEKAGGGPPKRRIDLPVNKILSLLWKLQTTTQDFSILEEVNNAIETIQTNMLFQPEQVHASSDDSVQHWIANTLIRPLHASHHPSPSDKRQGAQNSQDRSSRTPQDDSLANHLSGFSATSRSAHHTLPALATSNDPNDPTSNEPTATTKNSTTATSAGAGAGVGAGAGAGAADNAASSSKNTYTTPEYLLPLLNGLESLEYNVFDLAMRTSAPLHDLTMHILDRLNLFETMSIQKDDMSHLLSELDYASRVEGHPFHNSVHAADLVQFSYFILTSTGLLDVLSSLEVFALIFTSAIIDSGHPGVTPAFLERTSARIALIYNNIAVIENAAVANAFQLAELPGMEIFAHMDPAMADTVRQLIIQLALASELRRHVEIESRFRTAIRHVGVSTESMAQSGAHGMALIETNETLRTLTLQVIIKLSLTSFHTRDPLTVRKWSYRFVMEGFAQGEKERQLGLTVSPFLDGSASSIALLHSSFIELIALPLYRVFTSLFPVPLVVQNLVAALSSWRSKGSADVSNSFAIAQKSAGAFDRNFVNIGASNDADPAAWLGPQDATAAATAAAAADASTTSLPANNTGAAPASPSSSSLESVTPREDEEDTSAACSLYVSARTSTHMLPPVDGLSYVEQVILGSHISATLGTRLTDSSIDSKDKNV